MKCFFYFLLIFLLTVVCEACCGNNVVIISNSGDGGHNSHSSIESEYSESNISMLTSLFVDLESLMFKYKLSPLELFLTSALMYFLHLFLLKKVVGGIRSNIEVFKKDSDSILNYYTLDNIKNNFDELSCFLKKVNPDIHRFIEKRSVSNNVTDISTNDLLNKNEFRSFEKLVSIQDGQFLWNKNLDCCKTLLENLKSMKSDLGNLFIDNVDNVHYIKCLVDLWEPVVEALGNVEFEEITMSIQL